MLFRCKTCFFRAKSDQRCTNLKLPFWGNRCKETHLSLKKEKKSTQQQNRLFRFDFTKTKTIVQFSCSLLSLYSHQIQIFYEKYPEDTANSKNFPIFTSTHSLYTGADIFFPHNHYSFQLLTQSMPRANSTKATHLKLGLSKRHNLKKPVYHILGMIRLIFSAAQTCNSVRYQFISTKDNENITNCFVWKPVLNGLYECSGLGAMPCNASVTYDCHFHQGYVG